MAEATAPSLHEPDVPSVRMLSLGGAAVLGMVVVAVIVAVLVVRGLTPERGASRPVVSAAPEPPLQVTPERDFPAYQREKRALLHEYAWVDRAHGVVRIPIERAMDLLVERQSRGGRSP